MVEKEHSIRGDEVRRVSCLTMSPTKGFGQAITSTGNGSQCFGTANERDSHHFHIRVDLRPSAVLRGVVYETIILAAFLCRGLPTPH